MQRKRAKGACGAPTAAAADAGSIIHGVRGRVIGPALGVKKARAGRGGWVGCEGTEWVGR